MALRLLVLATAIGGAVSHATSLTDYGSRELASRLGSYRNGLSAVQALQARSRLAPLLTDGYNGFNNRLNIGLNNLPIQPRTLGLRTGYRGIQDSIIPTELAHSIRNNRRCNCGVNEVCQEDFRGFSVCRPINQRGLLNNIGCGIFRPDICLRRPILGSVRMVVYSGGRCVERTISGVLEECRCNGGSNGVFNTFAECHASCQLPLFP